LVISNIKILFLEPRIRVISSASGGIRKNEDSAKPVKKRAFVPYGV